MCGTCKCYSAPVVDYRRCLSPCRCRVPCIPVRLIVSSYCIPVSFAIFAKFLPFLWGLVVSVFSHFLLAWFLRGFSQWFFTRRIPKVQRNVGNLAKIGPFTLMVARVLSLRRAALAGALFYHLVARLVHQCFCSRDTARGDDRASSLKKRVRYS